MNKSSKSIKCNSNDRIFDSNNYSIKSKSQKSIQTNDDFAFKTQSSPNLLITNQLEIPASTRSCELNIYESCESFKLTTPKIEKQSSLITNFMNEWISQKISI